MNFGVYLNSIPARPLLEVYVSAWPFDFRLLVSTLLFTCLFWLTERMISKRFRSAEVKLLSSNVEIDAKKILNRGVDSSV